MAAPTNRIPVRLGRGTRAALEAGLPSIQEGELVYARDQDSLFVKENGVLVNVAQGIGVADFLVSAEITWTLGLANGGYTFSGQGFYGNTPNPTLYLMRGQRYKFVHNLGTDPFQIQVPDGPIYSVGIENNPAFDETMSWAVSMEAPSKLRYVSLDNPDIQGEIFIITDGVQGDLSDLDDVSDQEALNGQALLYSSATGLWSPANLQAGGVTNLAGLTDVDIPEAATNEVLTYSGNVWESKPLPANPNSSSRKTAININASRTGQMLGTEFPLGAAELEVQGWNVQDQTPRSADDWVRVDLTSFDRWTPLGRSDSSGSSPYGYIDGSGRLVTVGLVTGGPNGWPTVSSTIRLSVPEAAPFSFVPFLDGFDTTLQCVATKVNVARQGRQWDVVRAEYLQGADKELAIEVWLTRAGDIKIMYGRQINGFVINTDPNKNGIVFVGRSTDETIGSVNNDLPGLGPECDYVIELWVSGVGFAASDLTDIYSSDIKPARPGQALTWVEDKWEPGSNVELGTVASTSSGYVGQFKIDSQWLYVAVGDNTWKRIPLETFS